MSTVNGSHESPVVVCRPRCGRNNVEWPVRHLRVLCRNGSFVISRGTPASGVPEHWRHCSEPLGTILPCGMSHAYVVVIPSSHLHDAHEHAWGTYSPRVDANNVADPECVGEPWVGNWGRGVAGKEFQQFRSCPRKKFHRMQRQGKVQASYAPGTGFPNQAKLIWTMPGGATALSKIACHLGGIIPAASKTGYRAPLQPTNIA